MIVGCGIDTEEKSRFSKHLSNFEKSEFISMVFTEGEKENFLDFDPELCVPIAFSFKEAMFKALGNTWTTSAIDWKDMEIKFLSSPQEKNYELSFSGVASEMLESLGNPNIISSFDFNDKYSTFDIILKHE